MPCAICNKSIEILNGPDTYKFTNKGLIHVKCEEKIKKGNLKCLNMKKQN